MLPLDIAYGALPKLNSPILTVPDALLFQSPKAKKTVSPSVVEPLRFDKLTAEFVQNLVYVQLPVKDFSSF